MAIHFEVDGHTVLATGDQYAGENGLETNYVYPNRFESGDYVKSAALYQRLQPDLILTGHWQPFWVPDNYFEQIESFGAALESLHNDLLPDLLDLGTEGFLARITPYQAFIRGGYTIAYEIEVRNPFDYRAEATLRMVVPYGWEASVLEGVWLEPHATCIIDCQVQVPAGLLENRARIAVDLSIDGRRFGQQAEALISSR